VIFLFSTASRPTLGPIRPPIQWVQGDVSLGTKEQGCEAHRSPSCAETKNGGAIPPLPESFLGVKLNLTLPFAFTCFSNISGHFLLIILGDPKTSGTPDTLETVLLAYSNL
jgi:hypothetical protein